MQPTQLDNSTAADRLIAAHDGDVALLYIYARRSGSHDLEKAAGALCRTLQELRAAEEKLRRMGLWDEEGQEEPHAPPAVKPDCVPPADELPQYSAEEITRLAVVLPGFEAIRSEATKIKGKQLTSNDLRILIGFSDYLALPPEVVLELLHYCAEKAEAQRAGSRPSFRTIQQEAFRWARLEILTLEQAEEYIRREKERSSACGRVQALLGLQGRALTGLEREHIRSWLEMGFSDDAIQFGYERTVYNTGSLKWAYMDKILRGWHEAGLHERKTIEAKDRPPRKAGKPSASPTTPPPVDLGKLEDILKKM